MTNVFDPSYIAKFLPILIKALPVTLLITVVAMIGGLILGFIVAIVKIKNIPVLKQIFAVYVSFMRGTPLLVQLFLSYYGLPILLLVVNEKFNTSFDINHVPALIFVFVAFILNEGAYLSETIRASILSIDKNEIEAAMSLGMTSFQIMIRVTLPQALVVALPILGNTLISLIKNTSLAFTVAVQDIMGAAKVASGRNLRFFEVYIAASIIYWIVCIVIEFIAKKVEKKIDFKRIKKPVANKYELEDKLEQID
ncbi:MAG: amino acid ABC transporter permease [Intestinibacter sp.]|uniref:amino acid ABC transporter permease n=1 Tax=Intestinibacter sp. TaxID=1965304 RepID=UPI003F187770